uniref:Coiled-coil domain containing 50 n=1 Tax=Ornithorhynchus anatinus TaxID=9258 RepID=A0A6I8N1K7_ORNAN
MAEIGIDQSKLPGVKEVCRDFAVLEDHTLAYSLQEQEIEHHLATNVQRNRLVQHDLQVAKQLQEEEDLKARAQIQKRHKDIEQQDCEIAQEIQVKLVIEAERRRRQEEKDEDIARLLQERELQEEKKWKKHYSGPPGTNAYEEDYYPENGDHPRSGRTRELVYESPRPRRPLNYDTPVRRRKEEQNTAPSVWEESMDPASEICPSSAGRVKFRDQANREQREQKHSGRERPQRPPLPKISGEVFLSPEFNDWESSDSRLRNSDKHRSHHQDRHSPKPSPKPRSQDKEDTCKRDHGPGVHRDKRKGQRPGTPPSSQKEARERDHEYLSDPGIKPKGTKEAISSQSRVAHRDQELYDAEIARKLQEEELMANQIDKRAAQVAQDEEIARLLMAEEKKAYKKVKEREKSSLERRKQDPEWKFTEPVRPKSRESHEPHRSKNDKPARPPPPSIPDAEDLDYSFFTHHQPSSTRPFPKPEPSHKGRRWVCGS